MTPVFLNWQLNNGFGWGILGLNLFFQWANDPQLRPQMGSAIRDTDVMPMDPLRLQRAMPAIVASNQFLAGCRPRPDGRLDVDAVLIDAMGNDFTGSPVHGRVNVARAIFENTRPEALRGRFEKYGEILTASSWNARIIEAATGRRPKVVFEGVDETLFLPGPRTGLMDPSKFYIFTGGKIEFRKGQDLVLLAFREFSRLRPDAVLVTAWHSPWPQMAAGFAGRLEHPVRLDGKGQVDVARWVADNGIDPARVVDIGRIPNAMMPAVLREMDVCLQPSRAEACTNLPVKEAMAAGVPVIAARNTGMLDLLTEANCLPLLRQGPVEAPEGWGVEGWGESEVDEIVAWLEYAYSHRERARERGLAARRWLIDNGRTWSSHARELKSWLLGLR